MLGHQVRNQPENGSMDQHVSRVSPLSEGYYSELRSIHYRDEYLNDHLLFIEDDGGVSVVSAGVTAYLGRKGIYSANDFF